MKALFVVTALTTCLLPGPMAAQGLKDLLRGVQKAIEQKADEQITEKVENPCIQKEDTAKVDTVDRDKKGTWVVEISDGRKFQVSDLAIAGVTDDGSNAATFLSLAQVATFSLLGQERLTKTYRVHIDYAPVVESGGGARGFLGAIVNNVAQGGMKNDFTFTNLSVAGSSVDGRDWCLNVPTSSLRSISLVKD